MRLVNCFVKIRNISRFSKYPSNHLVYRRLIMSQFVLSEVEDGDPQEAFVAIEEEPRVRHGVDVPHDVRIAGRPIAHALGVPRVAGAGIPPHNAGYYHSCEKQKSHYFHYFLHTIHHFCGSKSKRKDPAAERFPAYMYKRVGKMYEMVAECEKRVARFKKSPSHRTAVHSA